MQVQSKYDQVRLTSLDSACNAHKLVQSTIGKPHESRKFNEGASLLRRKSETKDNKGVVNRDTGNINIDPSNNVSRKLDKFKEIVNSRI